MRAPPPPKASNYNNRPPGKAATINNITAEEAEKSPDVMLGMLPVNSILAKVLFDTGASHSFVSQKFAQMHELSLASLPNNLMVKSPGAEMTTSKISHGNKIKIEGHIFLASLIILGNSEIGRASCRERVSSPV